MLFDPKNFFSYFQECYKLDYKEFTVDNILAQKYPFKWFVSGEEELLSDSLPSIPYFNKKVDELEKELELHHLEKKLFYGCFFVLGENTNPLIKDKRICAPLLLFPTNIFTVAGERFIEIDKDSFVINRSILSHFDFKDETNGKDEFIKELMYLVENQKDHLLQLKDLFEKYFTNIDSESLLMHPRVWSVSKVRSYFTNTDLEEGKYKIVPSAGTVLIEKSESTLKVLNDYTSIIQEESYNTSLKNLFSDDDRTFKCEESLYKSRLNTDQTMALDNGYRFINSVIVGPPGTGKTYTITSIISDLVAKNQSVLVVSKTTQAVEVIRTMLENDFKLKEYIIHTTGTKYKISLKAKIKRYLSGIFARRYAVLNESQIFGDYSKLKKLEEAFERLIDIELQKSDLEFSSDLSFFDKWRKMYYNSILFKDDKLWDVFDEIEAKMQKLDNQITTYSKRKIESNIQANSKSYRRDITRFYDALDANSFTEYKKILKSVNQSNVLKLFPIWLANLSDLNSVLPLEKDMFDVVIIDEATQCDVSIALPGIYRAKRAIVVGDPNQLRHYSFVSHAQQLDLQKRYDLPNDKMFDYRNRSILDLYLSRVVNQEQVSFLREHFRSTPSLIEFSNEKFYSGQLEVIKSTPKYTRGQQIELIDVDGARDSKGVNKIEAQAVIQKLRDIIEEHQESKHVPSIGIISLFSSQVTYINKLLKAHFDLKDLKKFKLLCGTPYSFQGSEREIILLSCNVCDKTHHSAFIHANKPEVLNVAITRAKSFQYVFKSVSDEFCKKETLLFDYFRFIKSFSNTVTQEPEKDQFQLEVEYELKTRYDKVQCGYPVAGCLLDILITHNDQNYFIDLIGYPGMFREAFPLERYKTLGRSGIRCMPLHYSYWKTHRQASIRRIERMIHNGG